MKNLQGNTILITGAVTGMGFSAAKWFSEQGNNVILVSRNESKLKKVASELQNATYIVCDLNNYDDLESLVIKIKTEIHTFCINCSLRFLWISDVLFSIF